MRAAYLGEHGEQTVTDEPPDALTNTLSCGGRVVVLTNRLPGWAAWIMTGEVLRQRARLDVRSRMLVSKGEETH